MEKELLDKLTYLIKKVGNVEEIANKLEMKEYEILGLIEILKKNGVNVIITGNDCVISKIPLATEKLLELRVAKDYIKVLHLSDTHLASKYDNVSALREVYEFADKENVDFALHSGDVVDGRYPSRAGNEYELKELSYKGQLDYAVDKYPHTDKFKTYFITGNHDVTWYKICGNEIGKDISNQRDDLIYLGQDVADIKINGMNIRMYHGKKGQSYARSYMIQKYLDNLTPKPDILQTGHVHYAVFMKYLDTYAFQTASLQLETPFSKSLGLADDNSVWLCSYGIDRGKIVEVNPKLLTLTKKGKIKRW